MDLISNAKRFLPTCTFAVALTACGSSAPTHELADARDAYDDAADGPARTHRPGELRAAHRALDRAEEAHDDNPGSNREKQLAIEAEHRAEIADARGEAAQAEGEAQAARARANREARVLRARDDRSAGAKVDRDGDKAEVVVNDAPARTERADNDTRDVDSSLEGLMHGSTVRKDERGTVIIMSGAMLFSSGKDELSDDAEEHLDQVAKALKDQPESTKFRVEGYTDSTGSERQNQALSTNRARAVAKYLSDEGIDSDRIEAVGYGEQRPLASNDSDEGRASNRRIEIVIAKNANRDDD